MRDYKCPSCVGRKDSRAKECRDCRFKNHHPRLGTGNAGIGKCIMNGYVMITSGHEMIYEHRVVMEKILGRKLASNEHVHHINHNKTDNAAENLLLMSASEHAREHFLPRAKEMSSLGHRARWGK